MRIYIYIYIRVIYAIRRRQTKNVNLRNAINCWSLWTNCSLFFDCLWFESILFETQGQMFCPILKPVVWWSIFPPIRNWNKIDVAKSRSIERISRNLSDAKPARAGSCRSKWWTCGLRMPSHRVMEIGSQTRDLEYTLKVGEKQHF